MIGKIDRKLEQIRLQHQIMEILRQDNGVSCHFDYHVNPVSEDETVKLNLLTYNPKHNEYMLLHCTTGKNSIDCLNKMITEINALQHQSQFYSFMMKGTKKSDGILHVSYFRATDEGGAELKFLHEKNASDYTYTIEKNPIS
jgi:hypothetical protein